MPVASIWVLLHDIRLVVIKQGLPACRDRLDLIRAGRAPDMTVKVLGALVLDVAYLVCFASFAIA